MILQNQAPGIVKARYHKVMRYGQTCHPKIGMSATFVPDLMLMILRCKECNTEVMRFEVAKEFSKENTDGGQADGQVRG